METKVYIIIVTFNAMKWVDRCLGSLRESIVPVFPVVIDNCSSDETVEYIRSHFQEVHLIVNQKNRGFGQANNQGIEWAYQQGGTHFFLLNQDAWVHPDTVERLVAVQDKEDIALVSPVHLNGPGNRMDYGFFSKVVIYEKNIEYVSDLELNNLKPYYIAEHINAAAWMLSRKTIQTIGGFDPIFFHYGEDGNYSQRLKYHEEKMAYVPGAYIHHDRILQGNMKTYKKKEVVMHLLNMYTDINRRSFGNMKGQLLLHFWLMKKAFLSLVKLKFIDFWNIIQGYISFICKIPQIHYSKVTNTKKNPNWLNINL